MNLPYTWTHIIFGDEITKRVNRAPKNKTLYQLGCQGPDFFFFYRFWPWLESNRGTILGDLFHTVDCGPVLIDLIVKAKELTTIQDYVAGFITHHILDRTTHSYIHFYAGYEKYKHQQLESTLDTLIAKELRGINTWNTPVVPQIDVGNTLPNDIVETLYKLASTYYPAAAKKFTKMEYHQAYRDMKRFLTFTFDPHGIKTAITFGLISPFRFTKAIPYRDYFNLEKKTWLHPAIPEEKHTESFWELWKMAVDEGTTIMSSVYDYWSSKLEIGSLVRRIGNISYDNGTDCDLRLVNLVAYPIV